MDIKKITNYQSIYSLNSAVRNPIPNVRVSLEDMPAVIGETAPGVLNSICRGLESFTPDGITTSIRLFSGVINTNFFAKNHLPKFLELAQGDLE